jgi:hypothetical protein
MYRFDEMSAEEIFDSFNNKHLKMGYIQNAVMKFIGKNFRDVEIEEKRPTTKEKIQAQRDTFVSLSEERLEQIRAFIINYTRDRTAAATVDENNEENANVKYSLLSRIACLIVDADCRELLESLFSVDFKRLDMDDKNARFSEVWNTLVNVS